MISKEVLNIVLAVVILWVGIFACWMLYYAARILQQSYRIFKRFSDSLQKFDDAVKSIKEKFEHSATYFGLVAEGVKEVVKYLSEKKRMSTRKHKEEPEDSE